MACSLNNEKGRLTNIHTYTHTYAGSLAVRLPEKEEMGHFPFTNEPGDSEETLLKQLEMTAVAHSFGEPERQNYASRAYLSGESKLKGAICVAVPRLICVGCSYPSAGGCYLRARRHWQGSPVLEFATWNVRTWESGRLQETGDKRKRDPSFWSRDAKRRWIAYNRLNLS